MTKNITFKVKGMHCSSCNLLIEGELEEKPGVIKAVSDFKKEQTQVEFDESKISMQELKSAIESLGDYQVMPLNDHE